MKKNQLEELTTESLKQKIKATYSMLYVAIVLLLLYAIFMFYQMFEGTWKAQGPQIIVPFIFVAILIPNIALLKKMKAELEKRQNNS